MTDSLLGTDVVRHCVKRHKTGEGAKKKMMRNLLYGTELEVQCRVR